MARVSPGEFIRQVRAETAKVHWPTRKETVATVESPSVSSTVQLMDDCAWQGQKDLNPRPSVLETDALPTELYPSEAAQGLAAKPQGRKRFRDEPCCRIRAPVVVKVAYLLLNFGKRFRQSTIQ